MQDVITWCCCVDGCTRPKTRKAAKGMCAYHYTRSLPRSASKARERGCQAAGCENTTRNDRLCSTHALERRMRRARACSTVGCDSPARGKGWCEAHYRRYAKYGVSPEAFETVLSGQGGGCGVCGLTESDSGHALVVDHDHSCCPGQRSCGRCVRGILCRSCNVGLGMMRDDPDLLLRAATYLNK